MKPATNKAQHQVSRTARLIGAILVAVITLAFGITVALLLQAKWNSFDPFLLDFAKTVRFYESILQGVPYEYPPALYAMIYAGYNTLLLPLYALVRSILLVFATHLLGFTLAIPVLYLLARRHLPGIALPLAVVVGFVLNPTLDMMALSFLRQEALWVLSFLLTVYWLDGGRIRLALVAATIGCLLRIDGVPIFFLWGVNVWLRNEKTVGKRLMKRAGIVLMLLIAVMPIFWLVTGIAPNVDVAHMADFDRQAGGSLGQYFQRMFAMFILPESYANLVLIFQFLLLPLLAPLVIMPASINIAYIVLSSQSYRAIPLVQSVLSPGNFLVPFIHPNDTFLLAVFFVATIYGLKRLTGILRGTFARGLLAASLIAGFFAVHWFFATPELGPIPLTPAFNLNYHRMTPHARLTQKMLAEISTEESGLLTAGFAERNWRSPRAREIYPSTRPNAETRFVLIDLFAYSTNMSKPQLLAFTREMLTCGDFTVERFEDGILLLRRGMPGLENAEALEAIATNEAHLARNLAGPYRFGDLSREGALRLTFSATMLPETP